MKKLLLLSLIVTAFAVSNVDAKSCAAKADCGSCTLVDRQEGEKPVCYTEHVIRKAHCPERFETVTYACPTGTLVDNQA